MQIDIEKVPIIQRGKIIIDRQSHNVIVDGKTVFLRAKEMKLLCLMAEHPKWIFTKEQIYEAIYNEIYNTSNANIVYCLIRDLRKKLKIDSDNYGYIQTIKDIGYRFMTPEE